MTPEDAREFLEAIAAAYPENAALDKFGRLKPGQGNSERLRSLHVKWGIQGGAVDCWDQAAKIARKMLAA